MRTAKSATQKNVFSNDCSVSSIHHHSNTKLFALRTPRPSAHLQTFVSHNVFNEAQIKDRIVVLRVVAESPRTIHPGVTVSESFLLLLDNNIKNNPVGKIIERIEPRRMFALAK